MKNRIKILFFILFLLIIAGLVFLRTTASEPQEAPTDVSVSAEGTPGPAPTATPSPEPTPEPTPTPTPEPTPEPTPDPNLYVESGSFMLTYRDPDTGDYLDYWVYIPENAVRNLPLIVFLHGDGYADSPEILNECGIAKRVEEIYGSSFPFIMITPCTRMWSWESGTVPGTLIGLIQYIVSEYDCDSDSIILTGHSRGAIGTWYLLNTYPDLFSRAVPVSCPNDLPMDYSVLAQTPVRAFVGGNDDDYGKYGGYMEVLVRNINDAGGDAVLTVCPGFSHGEMEYVAYTEDVFNWMLGIEDGQQGEEQS